MTPEHNRPKPGLARFTVERMAGHGWYVADPDGKRVSCFHHAYERAFDACENQQAAYDAAKKRCARPCLCCGQTFQSEGIHNRMCNPCRNRASNDEAAPFSFGAIHGRKRA